MAPKRVSVSSSGSEGDPRDAKNDLGKMKRKESNRLSAMRSRERKRQQVADLQSQVGHLIKENESYANKINVTSEMHLKVVSQNDVLRAQIAELTERLHSMNDVIQVASVVNGMAIDTQEIPDYLLQQWQLPCPPVQPISLETWQLPSMAPIAASANNFPY